MRRTPVLVIFAVLTLVMALAGAAAAAAGTSLDWELATVTGATPALQFADIAMLDAHVGVAGGEIEQDGAVSLIPVVYRTSDGGATWAPVTNQQLYGQISGVAFSDSLHAWAVGADYGGGDRQAALVLASADAGKTWARVAFTADAALQKVQFPSATTGYITGDDGTVYVTTDGGGHWAKKVPGAADVGFTGLSFTDAGHGWVCGGQGNEDFYGGRCYSTADGGATWKDVSPDPSAVVQDCSFVSGGHGWVVGQDGVIFRTTDGGASWARQHAAVGASVFFTGVGFVDADNGWVTALCFPPAFGGVGTGWGVILHTTDGGMTWVQQDCGVVPSTMTSAALDAQSAWVAGNEGLVMRTVDGGGAGFTPQSRPRTVALNAVTVRRGAKAAFRFDIEDPGVPFASVAVVILDARHHIKKTVRAGVGPTGETASCSARVSLPAGRYTWKVVCTDYAGYRQQSATAKPLIVK